VALSGYRFRTARCPLSGVNLTFYRKGSRYRQKGPGGVKYTKKWTDDFDEIIDELEALKVLVMRFLACIGHIRVEPLNNFHFNKKGELVGGPPPKNVKSA
jgi:hypothetical protein